MHTLSLTELDHGLTTGTFSSEELVRHFLDRINRYNPKLNAFITVTEQQALKDARQADRQRRNGRATPLTGIPLAHKDIFCTRDVRTSCGSRMLDNFVAPYDATVVENCRRAGLVMVGKTNMDEFAMGSSNENSFYGPVRNPWDRQRVPGGSSGGSATAVAAGLVPAATGTDTGGSIRQPAAFCGISGLKPTYGRISRWGMVAYASSLDQGGPMARSAEDLALLLQVMAGFDPRDSTCAQEPTANYQTTLNDNLQGLKIGLPEEFFNDDLDPDIAAATESALSELKKLGAVTVPVRLPHAPQAIAAYYVVAPAECSSNLARYDGVRFGHRCDSPEDLQDLYRRSRSEGFGDEVKRRIMIGTYALSAGYYDAYYLKAQKIRRLIRDDFQNVFQQVDLLACPTTPTTAFPLAEKTADPLTMYLSDMYTVPVNMAGLPGLSLPVGFHDGLPVGMQLIGNYFQEGRLLNVGHRYQQVTDWHRRTPEVF